MAISELRAYVWAFFSSWAANMNGLAALALTISAMVVGSGPAEKFLWVAAAFCWLLAGAEPWVRQYRRLTKLEKQLETQRPRLQGRVEWHTTGTFNGMRVLVAALRLDNAGADTQVGTWRALVRPQTKQLRKHAVTKHFDGGAIHVIPDAGAPFTLNSSDYFLNKLGVPKTPLRRNRYEYGFVIFELSVEPRDDDMIRYLFKDFTGRFWQAFRPFSDHGEIKEFPGLRVVV